MKKISLLISYLIPVIIRNFFFKLFALSIGKGFDHGSLQKEFDFIKKFLGKKVNILIDIGSNKGAYSDVFLKNYPNSNIYIFEPQKYLYEKLLVKYSNNKNIKIFNCAIDEEEKEANLYKSFDGDGEGSIYKRKYIKNEKNLKEVIKCKRLDEVLNIDRNQIIDFVKIDVEGNEIKTLRGSEKIIYQIKVLQIEFGGTWIDSRYFYRDLYEFFKAKNFKLYRMSPNSLIEIKEYDETDEYFSFTNFIAVNNGIK
tara:strand:- start:645 stop:1406 length:762 start_codon:yes stop_codon:yes gene_type:complete